MGKKTLTNGDIKIIHTAIESLQKSVTTLVGEVAATRAKVDERHEGNLRALENMSGDVHIVLSKVQDMPCKAHAERMKGLKTNVNWLWTVVSGTALLVIGAVARHVLGG